MRRHSIALPCDRAPSYGDTSPTSTVRPPNASLRSCTLRRYNSRVSLAPRDRLGPYEIVAPIGAGGMGEVYRARDTRLDRDVAIKILPPAFVRDPSAEARFER